MSTTLPTLAYAYDALEPHIDAKTMEIHHSKHHATYVTKFNEGVAGKPEDGQSLEAIFASMDKASPELLPILKNHAGGAWNHTMFWKWMTPSMDERVCPEKLKQAIERDFGGVEKLKEEFNTAAAAVFGSGWAWIIQTADGKLKVTKTANQENPLMNIASVADKGNPILGIDVWEHAYYLKHQNKRPDYINDFWAVINWQFAGSLLK